MDCDIVIPFMGNLSNLVDCINVIETEAKDLSYRIHVLNFAKVDYALPFLAEQFGDHPEIRVVAPDSLQPGPNRIIFDALAAIIAASPAQLLLLIREDTLLPKDWYNRAIKILNSRDRLALATPLTNLFSPYRIPLVPGMSPPIMDKTLTYLSSGRAPRAALGIGCNLILNLNVLKPADFLDFVSCPASQSLGLVAWLDQRGLETLVADNFYCYQMVHATYQLEAEWQSLVASFYPNNSARILGFKPMPLQDWDPRNQALQLFFPKSPHDYKAAARETARRLKKAVNKGGLGQVWRIAKYHGLGMFRARIDYVPPQVLGYYQPAKQMRVIYLLNNLVVSGGVFSVVQIVNQLNLLGVDAKIVYHNKAYEVERWKLLSKPLQFSSRAHLLEHCPQADILVATHWATANLTAELLQNRRARAGAYFIQDYERWFYPQSDRASRDGVLDSYNLLPHKIVKSQWLADLLANDGHPSRKIHFGLDLGMFYPRRPVQDRDPVILAMARPGTPRRGFENVIETMALVKEAMPEARIALFGHDYLSPKQIPFSYLDYGVISDFSELAEMYSNASIFFEGSDFQGFGRVSLEAMACGAACVLTNVGGLHEYARENVNCLLTPPKSPEVAAAAILRLLRDAPFRSRLVAAGRQSVTAFCHRDEAIRTRAYFEEILAGLDSGKEQQPVSALVC